MFDLEKWAVWHFRATIVNDGSSAGGHSYTVTAGAGNVAVLMGGQFLNGDTVGRTCSVHMRDTDDYEIRALLPSTTVAAGARREFPTAEATGDDGSSSDGGPVILAGTEDLFVVINSLAINQNSELSLQFLVSAGLPSVALVSPGTAVETITENRIV